MVFVLQAFYLYDVIKFKDGFDLENGFSKELKVSVIIPVYNESENVDSLCRVLDEYAGSLSYALECIFVNDGSSDDTLLKLREYAFENVFAKIVNLSRNYGSHAAIRAGFTLATAPYTMLFSGDLQEPVELIDRLYQKATEGFEVVCVLRQQQKDSAFSRLYARLIQKYAVPTFPRSGLNNFMIARNVLEIIRENAEANSSVFLQILNLGFKSTSIECMYNEREKGQSKWTLSKKIKLFVDSFIAFSFMPIRTISVFGFVLALLGLLYALFIVVVKLFNLFAFQAGFPTIIAVILIGFGLTNVSLGVIAEYLWRTLDASRHRPVFIIQNVFAVNPSSSEEGDAASG